MASIVDRLLGRTDTSLAIVEPPTIEAKAVTGPGVFTLMHGTPLHELSRDPNRLMAEAQALFHTNVWIGAAERALAGRFTRMDWHLEDEEGETVGPESPTAYQAVLALLDRPRQGKTRRQLWSITFRHNGLAGNGFWFLDQQDGLAGTPLECLYINPARMTPVTDEAVNILGWILDAPGNPVSGQQGRPGVPLSKDEVIHFTLDEPDWGVWGIGIAESAQRKIELDKLTDNHSSGIFGSGGRLTGLIAPKEGVAVNDDQWKQFVNDYRRITQDPDAAKRLQIAKMPLDFTQMAANAKELQLTEISEANRDAILGAWGVPLTQLGIPTPAGLNSGERGKYDEAALWETVKARAEPFREKVQGELLDRFAELGVTVTLVFDYPEFDDESPMYENAERAKVVPLTVDQRLEAIGKDPLDPAIYGQLGQVIYIDQTMIPLFDPRTPSAPEPTPEALDSTTADESEVVEDAVKADVRQPLLGLRAKTETTWEPRIRTAVQKVLNEQKRDMLSKTEHMLRKPKETSWWGETKRHREMLTALAPLIEELATEVAGETSRTIKKPSKADTVLERILDFVRDQVGARVTGINRTTRDKVQAAVAEGIEKGLSPTELGNLLSESAAFDEARAEMIARTETAYAYNDSAIQSYRALDVEQVQVIDGDGDDICAPVNGATWSMDEALANPVGHPNCTRDFIPVVASVKAKVTKPTTIRIERDASGRIIGLSQ